MTQKERELILSLLADGIPVTKVAALSKLTVEQVQNIVVSKIE